MKKLSNVVGADRFRQKADNGLVNVIGSPLSLSLFFIMITRAPCFQMITATEDEINDKISNPMFSIIRRLP